jgi:hypothetical protein
MPMTLAVSVFSSLTLNASDVVIPRGTGLNSRFFAAATSSSRLLPAVLTSLRAASSVIQLRSRMRRSSRLGSSNEVPDQDVCTTFHP